MGENFTMYELLLKVLKFSHKVRTFSVKKKYFYCRTFKNVCDNNNIIFNINKDFGKDNVNNDDNDDNIDDSINNDDDDDDGD